MSHRPSRRDRAVEILARSLYRELKTGGYRSDEIVALCTELIDLLTVELRTAPRRPTFLSRADDMEAATDPAG